MRVLLVYPEFPDTFWSFRDALKFVGKKASMPPTGLLTIASMLPADWEKRLVDLNVGVVRKKDLLWADVVMISAMNAQLKSAEEIIQQCRGYDVTVVVGGPLFSGSPEIWYDRVDCVVSGEAEGIMKELVADMRSGELSGIYKAADFPDLRDTPAPAWALMDIRKYETVGIQFSRGCPHHCDFCNITALFGKRVRTKSSAQILAELDSLYRMGWRSGIFFVDDNFIGNKAYLKSSLLPALKEWRKNKPSITFQTETSILIADDDKLLSLMTGAGFNTVFIGIETPDEVSLKECGKTQNTKRNLLKDIHRIQNAGLQVQAGFIVGFDNDEPSVFRKQKDFIQKSGIATAMVAMLQAPEGTTLHKRMQTAGRIRGLMNDGTDGTTNIVPSMGIDALKAGHTWLVKSIYSPVAYYERVKTFLLEYKPACRVKLNLSFTQLMAIPKSIVRLGIMGRERMEYWKLFFWTWFKRPNLLPLALRLAIYGHHCSKIMERL